MVLDPPLIVVQDVESIFSFTHRNQSMSSSKHVLDKYQDEIYEKIHFKVCVSLMTEMRLILKFEICNTLVRSIC